MRRGDADREVTIDGVIAAETWDDNFNLVGARIVSPDGRGYILEGDFFTAGLLELVHERLRVTGIVREDEDGSKTLFVTEWEVLDE